MTNDQLLNSSRSQIIRHLCKWVSENRERTARLARNNEYDNLAREVIYSCVCKNWIVYEKVACVVGVDELTRLGRAISAKYKRHD
jgi:hypothetical protein